MKLEIIDKGMSITELYDCVAIVMGYNPSQCTYDCTKIRVSKYLAENVENYYTKAGAGRDSFAMNWVCFGPKVDEQLKNCEVEVEDRFIILKEEN